MTIFRCNRSFSISLLTPNLQCWKRTTKGKLIITTEKSDGIIRISFADDGPGISKENLKHIFDPFFTTKEVGKGTGLGLSICHGIVTEHGGKIYATSEKGQGAIFIIELPLINER